MASDSRFPGEEILSEIVVEWLLSSFLRPKPPDTRVAVSLLSHFSHPQRRAQQAQQAQQPNSPIQRREEGGRIIHSISVTTLDLIYEYGEDRRTMGLYHTLIHGLSLGKVSGLYRYAVKGLSADTLEQVQLVEAGAFPDDRRFALIKEPSTKSFDPQNPEWLHKENFLCVFTDPHLLARFRASYSIRTCQDGTDPNQLTKYGTPCDTITSEIDGTSGRFLTLFERSTGEKVLDQLDMSRQEGQQALAEFFSKQSGIPLVCVTATNHQFGNTSSGWKQKEDTRTIHIVNESTVKALESAIGKDNQILNPTRFRPNVVVQNDKLKPFSEFDWIGKSIQCGPALQLEVISKAVRCQGVNIDPLDPQQSEVDIPGLLAKHFPEHGPYLGVYAVVKRGGQISLGDDVSLI